MKLEFPSTFNFGTSTAAYQIETAFEHDWKGVKAKDGNVFDRTCDHELRFKEDAEIIAYCAPHYRMSLMWSKLQRAPYEQFNQQAVDEYLAFMEDLKSRGIKIMMVLHHFANPTWFARNNGWQNKDNIPVFIDFVKKLVYAFGSYVTSWNTFNEPNVYVTNGWLLGNFPPFKKREYKIAKSVIAHMGTAHAMAYDYIKKKYPEHPVGISHNTVVFEAENIWGKLPAKLADKWFMETCLKPFLGKLDFFGLSYYCRIGFDPLPITYMDRPAKIDRTGKRHDAMWEYYPEGLKQVIERYWNQFKLPIIITENGVCTRKDKERSRAIENYTEIVHGCLQSGIDIRAYYFWSTFDNFEWNLGPTYRFGLYETDITTKERRKRPSADLYHTLAYDKVIEV